jgi:nucleoside-diphosphate-sugar epimerase
MKRLLITGAGGFLGRHCLELLANGNNEVHAISRESRIRHETSHVSWHGCDLLNPGASSKLLSRLRPSHLLHLAWYAVPGKFWEAPDNKLWIQASAELMRSFMENGGERFVGAGSCAEYGRHAGECQESSTALKPDSLYGECKLAFQKHLEQLNEQSGVSIAWGRVFFLYGPFEATSRVVPYVIRSLLSGRRALCSTGSQILDFLHVRDVASAFVTLLSEDARGPLNIGSGCPIRLGDILLEIGRYTSATELIQFGARPSSEPAERVWANIQRITSETSWRPSVSLEQGIRETVEWWKQSSDRL